MKREGGSSLTKPAPPHPSLQLESPGRMEITGEASGPGPRTLHCVRPKPPETPLATPGPYPTGSPQPRPPQGPSPPPGTAAAREVDPTPASLTHTPHTKAPRPPPSRPHNPAESINEVAGARIPSVQTRMRAPAGRAAARLTIAPLDLHVNPDLDLAEVGRCHHLIWSSCGGPREGDRRAEKAGRGRGRCGRGSGCPRPRRPGRQLEHEPGPRGGAAGREAEYPGLQAGGGMHTLGRRGEATARAVRRRGGEWEGPRRPPRADAKEAGRRAPAQSAPLASLPLRPAFPSYLQAAPPSSAAGRGGGGRGLAGWDRGERAARPLTSWCRV